MNKSFKSESIVAGKTYVFALEIVKLYKSLTADKKEYVLSKQLLRSGTSVGANVNEAVSGHSKREFIYRLSIALKEAKETLYWLCLLKDSDFIDQEIFNQLKFSCEEIAKILSSIIITTKEKYFTDKSAQNSKL